MILNSETFLSELIQKADGALLSAFELRIKEIARDISPLRNLANVVTISTSS